MTSLIPLALAPELIGAIALFAVSVAGVAVAAIVLSKRTRVARSGTEQVLAQATKEAEALVKEAKVEAKAEAIRAREAFEKDATKTREELRERERLVVKREDTLDSKMETLAAKEKTVEAAERRVSGLEKAWNKRKAELDQMVEEEKRQLFKISGLGPNEARTVLLERMEAEVQHEGAALIQRATERAQETADQRAREILAATVQRLASDYTSEATVATVDIPSDEMKGRIIGREGRNIRAFERVTGVDVIVDDTPGVVVLSSFDPVRREIARRSLAKLITDGRIQPPRIEQIVSECRKDVEHEMNETGKQVALDTGVKGLHPKEVQLLGRLKFRTSYGQSVLQHSIEVSALAGSAPTWPAATTRLRRSFTPSASITSPTSRACCTRRSCRRPTPSAPAGPARGVKRSRNTSSAWRNSRASPAGSRASRAPSPSRPAVRFVSSSTPTRSMTSWR